MMCFPNDFFYTSDHKWIKYGEPVLINNVYTSDHRWIRFNGNTALIGITDYAQNRLGVITQLEFVSENRVLDKNETFGKIFTDHGFTLLQAPLPGKVIAVNKKLLKQPGLINRNPYSDGWLIRLATLDTFTQELFLYSNEYMSLIGYHEIINN